MALKHNLIANYLGQGWSALMGFAFVPLYIKYLGIEAYGLIGFFALLLAWLSLLDMGMSPTLSREMARFTGGGHTSITIRDLLRSVEMIAVVVASVIVICIYLAADWLATSWVNSETIPSADVANAIAVMGLVIATRFIEAIYRSSMTGLQRQVLLNAVGSTIATLRGGGAVIIMAFVSPTIQAFFLWQGIISIMTVMVLAFATYQSLPNDGSRGSFSWPALRNIKNFAGGIVGISVLSLLLTQIDKIILSKMLSLTDFGYYTLASVLAGALYTLVMPITQAWFPRLTQLHESGNRAELIQKFHQGAQLVSVIAGSASLVMIFQGETFLRLWTQDVALAAKVAPLLSLLAMGYLLNMLMWIPFETQLAHGSVKLPMKINIVAVLFITPTIMVLTPQFGSQGAAWAWILLNTGYVLIGVHFMFRKVLPDQKWNWYLDDVLKPLFPPAIIMTIAKPWIPQTATLVGEVAILLIYAVVAVGMSIVFAKRIRLDFFKLITDFPRLFIIRK
jgi:O-antigen/teichoic acid export membrane protein